MAGQVLLIAAVLAAALVGRDWSGGYAVAAYAAGGILIALGLLLLGAGALRLGSALTPLPVPRAGGALRGTGPYRLVRHPMYGGGILVALGWTVIFASVAGLGVTLLLGVFLDLKARREELWLVARFPDYEAYRKGTPRKLVPFVY